MYKSDKKYPKLVSYKYGNRSVIMLEGNGDFENVLNKKAEIIENSSRKNAVYACVQINDNNLNSKIKAFSLLGFRKPHVVISPNSIVLLKKEDEQEYERKGSRDLVPSIVKDLINNYQSFLRSKNTHSYENLPCTLNLRLGKTTLKTLKEMVYGGNIDNSGTQEFTGKFYVESISKYWKLSIQENTVSTGKDDEVDGDEHPFSFHTHPKETYKKFKVKYAWPSGTDYESIWEMLVTLSGIMHIVASLEGLYVVSLGEEWVNKLSELKEMSNKEKKKLLSIYKLPYTSAEEGGITPEQYIKVVEDRKSGKVFEVQYFSWANAEKSFRVLVPRLLTVDGDLVTCKHYQQEDI